MWIRDSAALGRCKARAAALGASALEALPFATSEQYGLLEGYYPFFGRVLLYAAPLAVLPMPGAPPFLFVVDASNVALRHGHKETFSCRGVEICLDYLGRRFPGARVALFLPDYLLAAKKGAAKKKLGGRPAETPDDVVYLQGLQRRGVLFGTPSQDYDDAFSIIDCSEEKLEIVIHITDLSSFVTPGDKLFKEAEAVSYTHLTLPTKA